MTSWDELKRLARHAARVYPSGKILSSEDRYIAALDAIVDAHLAGEEDLRQAGYTGIALACGVFRHHHGLTNYGNPAPKFWVYWDPPRGPGFEERIDDELAIAQVWAALPERHQVTLFLLAEHGSASAAAAAAGLPYGTFAGRLFQAREEARRLWHSPDPAPDQWRKNGRRGPDSDREHLIRLRYRRTSKRKVIA